jgi:hypothetical protein
VIWLRHTHYLFRVAFLAFGSRTQGALTSIYVSACDALRIIMKWSLVDLVVQA